MPLIRWLHSRDAGLSALRRTARTAIIMPALFAFGTGVVGNSELATLVAFGAFATLMFVDFGGRMRDRLAAQAGLVIVGAVLVSLGTVVSRNAWLAAATMAVVGFAVLFAGVVSSVLASAATSILLSFILPAMLPGPLTAIPARVAGWLLAGAVSMLSVSLLWPAPSREPLRDTAALACRSLAVRLRAEVAYVLGETDDRTEADAAIERADAAVDALRGLFYAAPYRPTGLATQARTVVHLVDEVLWLATIMDRSVPRAKHPRLDPSVSAVKSAAATLLEDSAAVLDRSDGGDGPLDEGMGGLAEALTRMERAVTGALPVTTVVRPQSAEGGSAEAAPEVAELVSSLEPSFRAQEMSFAIRSIAANVAATRDAQRRSWWDQVLGRQPEGIAGPLTAAHERAGAHVERHSAWLRNSLRGAFALGGAVLVADLSGVQHSFWVVLGTVAVLRSNALSTGQNILRAIAGTIAGSIVGGLLVLLIGTNTAVLWILLPPAIAFAGLAPSVISFAAGQAGFTVTLVILFNIIAPSGWAVGLVRVEDVAIGCAVSLVVGLLFWPRGATTVLAQALAEAYDESARYLRAAVDFGVLCCFAVGPAPNAPRQEGQRAAAAARRLDDAFRGFLAERGAKHLPLAQVAALTTGVAGLRLTADAVLELWSDGDGTPLADRGPARDELVAAADRVAAWYSEMGHAVAGRGEVTDPLPHDKAADARFLGAVRRDLHGPDGSPNATAVRMVWSGDHVDAARRLQGALVAPARAAAAVAS